MWATLAKTPSNWEVQSLNQPSTIIKQVKGLGQKPSYKIILQFVLPARSVVVKLVQELCEWPTKPSLRSIP